MEGWDKDQALAGARRLSSELGRDLPQRLLQGQEQGGFGLTLGQTAEVMRDLRLEGTSPGPVLDDAPRSAPAHDHEIDIDL